MLSPCSICPAHCCKTYTITVTSFDIFRIAQNTNKPLESFATLHPLRMLAYDPDMVLDIKNENKRTGPCDTPSVTTDYFLLGLQSHPCTFLGKDNLCTIHKFAPMTCRRYPFDLSDKLNTRFCPLPSQLLFRLKGPDIQKTEMIRELEAYKKIVKEWNTNQANKVNKGKFGTTEECMEFLMERTGELL
ncbi:YkgJ family cysteine cluster protein [Candidatus Micrarchaeota archaeon]|nr:YkgJ family cysteine cluster protein [Candidatus Micrarchaeota archaeon]